MRVVATGAGFDGGRDFKCELYDKAGSDNSDSSCGINLPTNKHKSIYIAAG
jgi:hypothetical protein